MHFQIERIKNDEYFEKLNSNLENIGLIAFWSFRCHNYAILISQFLIESINHNNYINFVFPSIFYKIN